MGHGGRLRLNNTALAEVLTGGARWAVEHGYGGAEDLQRIEEGGQILHAKPGCVSARAYAGSVSSRVLLLPVRINNDDKSHVKRYVYGYEFYCPYELRDTARDNILRLCG